MAGTKLGSKHEIREVARLTNVEAAWLAGVIDGEGCVRLETHSRPYGEYRYARLIVANTSLALLERIEKVTNVGRIRSRRKKAQPHHRDSWEWKVSGERALSILAQLMPWLIVKHEIALDAFEWREGGASASPLS